MISKGEKMGYKDSGVWKFFRSIRLTIVLLVILAAVAVIGTLVPQREEAAKVVEHWNPKIVEIFFRLGLFDLYHSALFRLILLALGLNLIVCSLDRLPKSLRLFKHSLDPTSQALFERPLITMRIKQIEDSKLTEVLAKALRLFGGRPKFFEKENALFAHSDYGRLGYFGVYFVHFSVLVILIGGLIGSIFGFEGYVNILEGSSVDRIEIRNGQAVLNLGFSLRCDRFRVEFYPNGTPKEYRSTVTILADGKELFSRDILVNHPLEINGIRFYQASYGSIPYEAKLRLLREEELLSELTLKKGMRQTLPSGLKVEVKDIRENFMQRLGPAVLIGLSESGTEEKEVWIFKNPEVLNLLPKEMRVSPRLNPQSITPYQIRLEDISERYYTGLQVSKDPGVNIVWIGCFLMVAGFFLTFFYPHRQIWMRLDLGKASELRIVARTNKDHAGLEARLGRVVSFLEKEIGIGEER